MPDKPPFGLINPQPYMAPAIERLNERFSIHAIHPVGWHRAEINALAEDCRARGIRAVGGFAQKDAFHHLLINEQLGNAVPSRIAFFHCMNKYLMRTLEQQPFFFGNS